MKTSEASGRTTEAMVMLVAVFATAMVYLDQNAVTVAMPAMQANLGIDVGGLQWMLDIYILTLASFMLIGGALGDLYGRVRIFMLGMSIFILTSGAAGMAGSLEILLAARAFQGIGGALLVPAGLAIINAGVPANRRSRAIGTWATFTSGVIAFGPMLGGLLVDLVGWRYVFYINVPLGALAIIAAYRYVPESRNENLYHGLDWPGVFTLLAGLGGLLFGLIEGPHLGWTQSVVLGSLVLGGLSLAAFIAVERKAQNPLIPLHIFRNIDFSGINLMTFIFWTALTGVLFFLTLNLQQVQGFTAFQAGLAIMPIPISVISFSKLAGAWSDRFGARRLILAGPLLGMAGFLLFTLPGVDAAYWTTFFPATLVLALGLGILIVPLTSTAMGSLPPENSGLASGANNAASRLANMVGIALFGGLLVSRFRTGLADRLAGLGFGKEIQTSILARAQELGATSPPEGLLSEQTVRFVREAVHAAFVDSYRLLMLVCAGISLLAFFTALIWVHPARVVGEEDLEKADLINL